jgi:hypothetical protein
VLTSAAPGEPLKDGLLLCRVSSWMTGTRLVSLPFADHCEPLLSDTTEFRNFLEWLSEECQERHWSYVEIRPFGVRQRIASPFHADSSYWFHELDLNPNLEQLYQQLHHNSFRRKIRRAERERLAYETGRSAELLDEFCRLLLMTRRRQHLLPQPRAWFENLVKCMGEKLQISIARKSGTTIAAMITLRQGDSVVYKYGCSDGRFHNIGGMPFLFWKLIEESKRTGAAQIDLGRCDLDNEGLAVFKDRLGARKTELTYYRYTNSEAAATLTPGNSHRLRGLSAVLPDSVLTAAGRLLYRHLG